MAKVAQAPEVPKAPDLPATDTEVPPRPQHSRTAAGLGCLFGARPLLVAAVLAGAAAFAPAPAAADPAAVDPQTPIVTPAPVHAAEDSASPEPSVGAPGPEAQPDVSVASTVRTGANRLSPVRIHDLALGDPRLDPDANAAAYAMLPAVMGKALDSFAEAHPEVNRSFAARFLELSLVTAVEVPWMVLSHEGGHNRVADKFGWDPKIEMTGWASGMTYYNVPKDGWTAERGAMASAAGVNQQEFNADYMYTGWAKNGAIRYTEAMGYLLAQTNQSLYAARSSLLDDPPGSDDMVAYVDRMNELGQDVSLRQLVTINMLTDLLSAPVWSALIGQGQFLANGDRVVEIPKFKIGETQVTFPSFHTLLATDGPIVGGRLLVNPDKDRPLELSFDTKLDHSAIAAGAKLHDLALADDVTINPFIRLTHDQDEGPGYSVGSDIRYHLNDQVSLVGTAEYSENDLLSEVRGRSDGLNLRMSVGFKF